LRPAEELWEERQRWFLVCLRATINLIDDETERSDALSELLTACAELDLPMKDGDLVILDKPFSSLNVDELDRLTNSAIAFEQALAWVCDVNRGWKETPPDTLPDNQTG
jgi:hypothetical protein